MMSMVRWGVPALLVLLAGCRGAAAQGDEQTNAQPGGKARPAQAAPAKPAPEEQGDSPPVDIKLEATTLDEASRVYELRLVMVAKGVVDAPVEVTTEVTGGGSLQAGDGRVKHESLPAGVTQQTLKVQLPEGAEAKVTVHCRHPKGLYGFHSVKVFPEKRVAPGALPARAPGRPTGQKAGGTP